MGDHYLRIPEGIQRIELLELLGAVLASYSSYLEVKEASPSPTEPGSSQVQDRPDGKPGWKLQQRPGATQEVW